MSALTGDHEFIVTVSGCTAEQAQQVMNERINYDEDYGFDYQITERVASSNGQVLRDFRERLIADQLDRYGVVLPDVSEVVDNLNTEADRLDLAASEDEYAEVQWNGLPGAVVESETNPWIKGPDGRPIKLHPGRLVGPCGERIHWTSGVLAPMDTDEGIQRCDACDIYPGDLEAAAAVARIYGPGFTVWFHGTNGDPA